MRKISLEIKATTDAIIQNSSTKFDDENVLVKTNENSIELKQIIFESIILNLPKKRQHNKDKDGKVECNQEMIDLIKKYRPSGFINSNERWNELKKIKLK